MITQTTKPSRFVLVRMDPGDDLLQTLNEAVKREELGNGIIFGGVGSLSQYRVHVVKTTNMPPGDVFFDNKGPWDILCMNGLIIDGRLHAHITLSNNETAIGGHLEEGCKVLTFCSVMIAETPMADYADWDKLGSI